VPTIFSITYGLTSLFPARFVSLFVSQPFFLLYSGTFADKTLTASRLAWRSGSIAIAHPLMPA
jgi:hypothetical protein